MIKKIILLLILILITGCTNSGRTNLLSSKENGYNSAGFNYEGIHKDTGTKYDEEGYNIKGYNKLGINRKGFDLDGYNSKWSSYLTKDEFLKLSDRKKIALKQGILILGMSKEEVLASIGKPKKIKQNEDSEIWQYLDQTLKFKNEMLVYDD